MSPAMTKCPPSCEPEIELSVSVLGPNLADVLARVPHFEGVSVQARQNMESSIRTLCRVGNRHPSLISIETRVIRNIMDQAPSTPVDLSPSRWRNVKSDVRRGVADSFYRQSRRAAQRRPLSNCDRFGGQRSGPQSPLRRREATPSRRAQSRAGLPHQARW